MQAAGVLLLLLLLLLAVPVNVLYALKREGCWRGRVIVHWMFGLVHLSFRPGRRRRGPRGRSRGGRGGRIARAGKGLVKRRRDLVAVLRSPGFARRLFRLIGDLIAASRPRRFQARFVVGLEDPADTGRLWGMLAPLRLLFGKRSIGKESSVSLEITPDFSGPRFQGYSCASLRFVPLRIIGLGLGFVFSAPVLRALRQQKGQRAFS